MTAHDARFVELEGAHNFRDLGGLPTCDGATTRSGVLYRSDALHHLELSDVGPVSACERNSHPQPEDRPVSHVECRTLLNLMHSKPRDFRSQFPFYANPRR